MDKVTGRNILLVDPEIELCSVISSKLQSEGFSCFIASNLQEGQKILQERNINLVISETHLPDGGGLDLLERESKEVPVIFLAACSGIENAKKALRSGAFDYLEKPVDLNKLADVVKHGLRYAQEYAGNERRNSTSVVDVADTSSAQVSHLDELTGLASHRYVIEKLPELYRQCRKEGLPLSLCLIDLEGFREFNTQEGLSAGDLVLIEVAKRLQQMVRRGDIVGRYGGDEFLVLLPGADKDATSKLAGRIIENFRTHICHIANQKFALNVCVGIVEIEIENDSNEIELFDRVIEAIHHAKLQGPGSVVVWNPQLTREVSLFDYSQESSEPMPDYESINIMMWRFRELNRKVTNVTMEALRVLVAAVEARDPYTKDHSVRVATFSRYIAEELDLPQSQTQMIHSAALLHDIGKIGISDAVLTKPGKLTEEEFSLIKQHPVIGVRILEQTRFFTSELPIIKHHHERFDGTGYPDGISGDSIPLGSRIITIADSTEAMLARRSYKEALDVGFVLQQLREGLGRQFDPMLAEMALKMIQQGILNKLWRTLQINTPEEVSAA